MSSFLYLTSSFFPCVRVPSVVDEFADEYQAYTERRPLLHFTPCPPGKQEYEEEEEEEDQVLCVVMSCTVK